MSKYLITALIATIWLQVWFANRLVMQSKDKEAAFKITEKELRAEIQKFDKLEDTLATYKLAEIDGRLWIYKLTADYSRLAVFVKALTNSISANNIETSKTVMQAFNNDEAIRLEAITRWGLK
jgi:hypothetical protein